MSTRHILIAAATGAVVLGTAGVVAAGQARTDDDERPITGDDLITATDAGLAHVGSGRVTETEVDDEDSAYEVEVTLDSGAQIDVQLDEDFRVVDSSEDGSDTSDDE